MAGEMNLISFVYQMKKRYFAFFTLTLFLLNTVVFPLLSYVGLRMHRYVMEEKAKEFERQITLQISFDELKADDGWMNEKEFSFKGDHYDVFSFVENDDYIILQCVKDTEEKSLFEKLAKYIDGDNHKQSPKNKNTNQKKSVDYFSGMLPEFYWTDETSSLINNVDSPFVLSAIIPVASPPPWLG